MLSLWNLQKITIFFRTAKPTLAGSLKFPWHGFPKTATARKKAKTNVWKSSHGAINDRHVISELHWKRTFHFTEIINNFGLKL